MKQTHTFFRAKFKQQIYAELFYSPINRESTLTQSPAFRYINTLSKFNANVSPAIIIRINPIRASLTSIRRDVGYIPTLRYNNDHTRNRIYKLKKKTATRSRKRFDTLLLPVSRDLVVSQHKQQHLRPEDPRPRLNRPPDTSNFRERELDIGGAYSYICPRLAPLLNRLYLHSALCLRGCVYILLLMLLSLWRYHPLCVV